MCNEYTVGIDVMYFVAAISNNPNIASDMIQFHWSIFESRFCLIVKLLSGPVKIFHQKFYCQEMFNKYTVGIDVMYYVAVIGNNPNIASDMIQFQWSNLESRLFKCPITELAG